ncbi:serine/threonine-protein kinase [Thermopolyspora sp. NPDC052614]|uniref:serine/threonine-protein kinase n=1 Tax=Thermopolyspora sp. NPDC052614 TaxID=3155682 RepID=UPI00343A812A
MPYDLPPALALDSTDPTELGPYRIASRLGKGGMGTVYLAEGPSGPVALKVINPHLVNDPEFRVRFRREVEAARRVRRFCTAPVLDAQLDGDPLWVVTEYVAGPDLGRVLRENGPLTGSNVEALAVGVATALTAIHDAGVVHRDLKPGNVLLSPLGPRVIDFGIARALDAGDGQTATGHILGTPDYMAPELFDGKKGGPPADVFAWGCLMVAATTGSSPFASKSVPQAFYRVVHEEPDLSSVDPGLRPIVEAALRKDPAARPTAQELLDTLVRRPHADTAEVAGTVRLDLSSITTRFLPAETKAAPADTPKRRMPRQRLMDMAKGAGACLLVIALVAGIVLGLGTLPSGPPDQGDVVYRDDFGATNTGWPQDGSGTTADRGYAGDGRYTMGANYTDQGRWAQAPVNAVLPDRAVVSVKIDVSAASQWTGVYCEYSKDDQQDSDFFYILELRDAYAKIVKAEDKWADLTRDVPLPGLNKTNVPLRVECARGDGEIHLAMWIGDNLIAEVSDTEVAKAVGPPRFGLYVEGTSEGQTRAFFDDFSIARLP